MNVDLNSKKVVLELSSVCNLNCKHCIYKTLDKTFLGFIPEERVLKLIDSFVLAKINKLVLTGGEPTLHPFFVEISRYAIEKIPKVSICTNGVIPNKDLGKKIINFNFSNYTISVDSHIENIHDEFRGVSGAFKQTILFLKQLKAKNKKISIHITLNPSNIDHIEEIIEFCKKFTDEVAVGTVYHNPSTRKESADFNGKVEAFRKKFIDDHNVILIGFTPFCKNKNCLDLKNVFMINCKGELVDCYWKKSRDETVKTNFKKYFITKV